MSNKYIEKFFFLTEKNISSSDSERITENAHTQNGAINDFKYTKYILAVFAGLAIYMMAHKKPQALAVSDNFLPKLNKVKVVAGADEARLTSIIPSFRLAARQQYLTQVPIKRMDLALLNASEVEREYEQQAHVMDKVLVVPKLFG